MGSHVAWLSLMFIISQVNLDLSNASLRLEGLGNSLAGLEKDVDKE